MSHIAVLPPISSGDCGMHDRGRKLLSRARRAYECGRLIVALRAAFVALALVGLAVVLGAPNTVTLLAGGALVLATGFCAFYGRALGSAAHRNLSTIMRHRDVAFIDPRLLPGHLPSRARHREWARCRLGRPTGLRSEAGAGALAC